MNPGPEEPDGVLVASGFSLLLNRLLGEDQSMKFVGLDLRDVIVRSSKVWKVWRPILFLGWQGQGDVFVMVS